MKIGVGRFLSSGFVFLLLLISCGGSSSTLEDPRNEPGFYTGQATGGLPSGGGGSRGPKNEDVGPGTGVPVPIRPGTSPVVGTGLYGQVTRASDGTSVGGAVVSLLDQAGAVLASQTADSNGNFSFLDVPPGTYALRTEAEGLLTSERPAVYEGGDVGYGVSLSAPVGPGQLRIVLSWGANPPDLDSHLWLPAATPYHLFFSREGASTACPFAALDVDDTTSFGPETVTISQSFSGTYEYAVYNYSGTGDFNNSEAFVEVYDQTGRVAGYRPPAGGSERWWRVFSFSGDTFQLTPINTLLDSFEPYPDTGQGCAGG